VIVLASASRIRLRRRAASLASLILFLFSNLCGMFGPLIASKPPLEEVGLVWLSVTGMTVTCCGGTSCSNARGTAVEHADGMLCVVPCGSGACGFGGVGGSDSAMD
jgi:hypothetical protein